MASPLDNVFSESSDKAALEKIADNQERKQNLKERAEEREIKAEDRLIEKNQLVNCEEVIKELESKTSRSEEEAEMLMKARKRSQELKYSSMGFKVTVVLRICLVFDRVVWECVRRSRILFTSI